MTDQHKRACVSCRSAEDREGLEHGVAGQEEDCRELAAEQDYLVGGVSIENDVSASALGGKPRRPAGAAEAERNAEHVARAARQRREDGRIHGGPPVFGYVPTSDGVGYCQVIDPAAAAAIKTAADMMLNGETVSDVMRYWNDLGLKRPNGKPWTQPDSVQKVLSSPRIAGYTSNDGKAVCEGNWPAIIDRATHEALVLACNPKVRHGKKPRKNLLPGVIFCACGSPMVANVALKHGLNRYLCRTQRGGCGQVSRHKPWVDDAVHEYVKVRIAGEARTSTLTTADTLALWARDDVASLSGRREILVTYVKMVIVKPLPERRLWGIRDALPKDCIEIVPAERSS